MRVSYRALPLFGFIASKITALAILAILLLGYLFFFETHSNLTHVYVFATTTALGFTIASGPKLAQHKVFIRSFWLAATFAAVLGTWKIFEHLSFFEGPEYGAATMDALAICAYWVALLYSQFSLAKTSLATDA